MTDPKNKPPQAGFLDAQRRLGELEESVNALETTPPDVAPALATTGAEVDVSAAAPPTTGQLLTATGAEAATWQDPDAASALETTGADVVVDAADPPTTGQVLTATGAEAATWQDAAAPPTAAPALETTGADVVVDAAAPPTIGQVLTATGAEAATWQDPAGGVEAALLYEAVDSSVLAQWMLDNAATDSSGNGLTLATSAGSNEFITDLSPDFPITLGNLPGTKKSWVGDNTSDWKGGAAGTDWDALRLSGAVAVSMEMWINPTSLAWKTLITAGKGGGSSPLLGIDYTMRFGASGKLRYIHSWSGGDLAYDATGPAVVANVWSHVAITRASDGKTIKMYINSVLVGSTTLSNPPGGGTDSIFYLGSDDNSLIFEGHMHGVQIRDIEVPHAKIVENYLRGRRQFI